MSFDNDVELRKVAAVYPEAQLLLRVVCEEGSNGSMDWIGLEVFDCVRNSFPSYTINWRSDYWLVIKAIP